MNKIIMSLALMLCVNACAVYEPLAPNRGALTGVIGVGGPIVLIRNDTGGACSAAVVDDNTLLTAKHCFPSLGGDVNVWTSPPTEDDPGPVSVGDTYIAAAAYDVVLVPLLWPLPKGTKHVEFSHKTFRRGDTATIVGWGCTHTGNVEARPVTYVDTVSQSTWLVEGTKSPGPGHEMMHFSGIACTGDSGGGVFDDEGKFVATSSSIAGDSMGRIAYVNAVSWQGVTASLGLDVLTAASR